MAIQEKRVKIFRNKKCRNIKKNIYLCDKINKILSQRRCFFGQKRKKRKNKEINILEDIVRLMALMCEIKSMHGLTMEFNTEETIKNIAQICGLELEEIPHCDTINDVFKII